MPRRGPLGPQGGIPFSPKNAILRRELPEPFGLEQLLLGIGTGHPWIFGWCLEVCGRNSSSFLLGNCLIQEKVLKPPTSHPRWQHVNLFQTWGHPKMEPLEMEPMTKTGGFSVNFEPRPCPVTLWRRPGHPSGDGLLGNRMVYGKKNRGRTTLSQRSKGPRKNRARWVARLGKGRACRVRGKPEAATCLEGPQRTCLNWRTHLPC